MDQSIIPPGKKTGLIPRDYSAIPVGSMPFAAALPDDMIIDDAEWQERFTEQQANKSSLLDVREANYDILKSLDQNGYGLCWAFSTVKAMMYVRVINNQVPYILSAWYVAGKIKNWRDQGGWGAASLAFVVKEGVPTMDRCPEYSPRAVADDAEENALLHRCEEWWDGSDNPDKAQRQLVSMLLVGIPCVVDLNSMAHSMCAIGIKSLSPLTIIYDNSWGESATRGLYFGKGADARPNGLVIPRVSIASQT